jgi:hypothetical protein
MRHRYRFVLGLARLFISLLSTAAGVFGVGGSALAEPPTVGLKGFSYLNYAEASGGGGELGSPDGFFTGVAFKIHTLPSDTNSGRILLGRYANSNEGYTIFIANSNYVIFYVTCGDGTFGSGWSRQLTSADLHKVHTFTFVHGGASNQVVGYLDGAEATPSAGCVGFTPHAGPLTLGSLAQGSSEAPHTVIYGAWQGRGSPSYADNLSFTQALMSSGRVPAAHPGGILTHTWDVARDYSGTGTLARLTDFPGADDVILHGTLGADGNIVRPSPPPEPITFEDIQFSPYIGGPVPDEAKNPLLEAIAAFNGLHAPLQPVFWAIPLEGGAAHYALSTNNPDAGPFIALWSAKTGAHIVEPRLVDFYLSQNDVIWDQKPYDETVLQRAVRYWGFPSNNFRPFKPGFDCPARSSFQTNPSYEPPYPINGCQNFVQFRDFLVDPLPGQALREAKPLPHDICSIGQGTAEGLAECPSRRHCPAPRGVVTGPYCMTEDEREGVWRADRTALPATCSSEWSNGWEPIGAGSCFPKTLRPVKGHATPKYMVLKVMYSPPGSASCAHNSSVDYTDTITEATAIDVSETFEWGHKTVLSVGGSGSYTYMGNSGKGSVTMTETDETSAGQTDTSKVNVSTTDTALERINGPCQDGLDHKYDKIQIALRPHVEITAYQGGDCGSCDGEAEHIDAKLSFSNQTVAMTLMVGELRSLLPSEDSANTMPLDAERRELITAAGLEEADILDILESDPFWNQVAGGDYPPPSAYRFERLGQQVLDYVPALGNAAPGLQQKDLSTTATDEMAKSGTDKLVTSVKFEGGLDFTNWLQTSLAQQDEKTWTWTNSYSTMQTNTTSNSAHLTLGRPAAGYSGKKTVALYLDTVYKTFAFVLQ